MVDTLKERSFYFKNCPAPSLKWAPKSNKGKTKTKQTILEKAQKNSSTQKIQMENPPTKKWFYEKPVSCVDTYEQENVVKTHDHANTLYMESFDRTHDQQPAFASSYHESIPTHIEYSNPNHMFPIDSTCEFCNPTYYQPYIQPQHFPSQAPFAPPPPPPPPPPPQSYFIPVLYNETPREGQPISFFPQQQNQQLGTKVWFPAREYNKEVWMITPSKPDTYDCADKYMSPIRTLPSHKTQTNYRTPLKALSPNNIKISKRCLSLPKKTIRTNTFSTSGDGTLRKKKSEKIRRQLFVGNADKENNIINKDVMIVRDNSVNKKIFFENMNNNKTIITTSTNNKSNQIISNIKMGITNRNCKGKNTRIKNNSNHHHHNQTKPSQIKLNQTKPNH